MSEVTLADQLEASIALVKKGQQPVDETGRCNGTATVDKPQYHRQDTAVSVFLPAMSMEIAVARREAIVDFVKQIMVPDTDFGVIPGTSKPTLLKPGAEKLCSFFGLSPSFECIREAEDWNSEEPFFYYRYRCTLTRDGRVMGQGEGSCNSRESKYRYRQAERTCPQCGQAAIIKSRYDEGGWLCWKKKGGCGATFADAEPSITTQQVGRVLNPDIADQVNTIQKLAQKRALIPATLIAVSASEFFTQDVEDSIEIDAGGAPIGTKEAAQYVAEQKLAKLKAQIATDKPKPFDLKRAAEEFARLKAECVSKTGSDALYYHILGLHGVEEAHQLKSARTARDCYRAMHAALESAKPADQPQPLDQTGPQPAVTLAESIGDEYAAAI